MTGRLGPPLVADTGIRAVHPDRQRPGGVRSTRPPLGSIGRSDRVDDDSDLPADCAPIGISRDEAMRRIRHDTALRIFSRLPEVFDGFLSELFLGGARPRRDSAVSFSPVESCLTDDDASNEEPK